MKPSPFHIGLGAAADEVLVSGRLDATQCDAALSFLNGVAQLRVIDFTGLDYIASAGLRVILLTQKRCKARGGVKLVNVAPAIFDIFRYAGFDQILDIVPAVSSRLT